MSAPTMLAQLGALASLFGQVGIVAVGGVVAVLPEIQRQVVDVHHWMDARTFGMLFAIAQAAPGPNMLVVTLVGWYVAGALGAIVATSSLVLPPIMLSYAMGSLWRRYRGWLWLVPIQAGLNAVTVGLIAAAALLLSEASAISTPAGVIVVVSSIVLIRTKAHPLWVLGAGAVLGASGVIG